jgi:surfeit locus 1 family protein
MLANSKPVTSVALTINWKITLLGLCFLPLLFRLGLWQIERADEKRYLIEQASKQLQLSPLLISEKNIPAKMLQQRRVIVAGDFLSQKYWLLDNRVFRGKVGYEVIAPVATAAGDIILVNRGWIQAPLSRQDLPAVDFPEESISVQGRWKLIEKNILTRDLEKSTSSDDQWPIRIQKIDLFEMQADLGKELVSGYLQINPEQPLALQAVWKNINVMPEKHMGYAVQWFAMTAALAIALIFANTNLSIVLRQVFQQRQPVADNNNKGEVHER